jgi:acetyl esterase/lipase
MAKEYWYFVSGMLLVLLPLLLLIAIKKLHLLEVRPDQKIVYTVNGNEKLTLHAFMAKHSTGATPTPAVLLFHGGRWMYGGPEEFYPQCQYFSAQGFSCFSAQYRLGANNQPDVSGAMADACAALDYLIAHAGDLRIDPDRIVVGGGSAGGHLAAALGSGLPLAHGATPSAVRRPVAQLLYNPTLDLAPCTPDHHLVKDFWQEVSPHHHIDSAVPPSLILMGTQDPELPVQSAQAFCDAVQAAGGHCELALYEGQGHGFYHSPEYLEKTNQRVLEFLRNLPGQLE